MTNYFGGNGFNNHPNYDDLYYEKKILQSTKPGNINLQNYSKNDICLLFGDGFYGKTGHSIDGSYSFASFKSF